MIGFAPFKKVAASAGLLLTISLVGCEKPSTPSGKRGGLPSGPVAVATPDDAIVDVDYCFRIEPMGTQWKLMTEKEVVRLLPDAVAGALSVGGNYAVVIVEPFPDVELIQYAEILRDAFPSSDGIVPPLREVTYLDKPAVRFSLPMNVNGLAVEFEKLIFLHQGFGYQLVAWGPTGRFSTSAADEFYNAFHLTEGTVKARSTVQPIADFDGVGRRVVDGRFESAIYKFAVKPPEGWQLIVGSPLLEVNTSAEIGFTHNGLGASVIVIAENIADLNPEEHIQEMSQQIGADMLSDGGRTLEPVNMTVGQKSIPFQRFVLNIGTDFRYYVGIDCANNCSYRILAWHQEKTDNDPKEAIAAAIQSIDFLDASRATKLATELMAQDDPQNIIGPGYCLRNGLYRDYRLGVTWKKPPGFWRVSLGDDARAQNPDCLLFAEEAESGLYAQWIAEESGDLDASGFHALAVRLTFGETHPVVGQAPDMLELEGAKVLVNEGVIDVDGVPLAYRLGTTVVDNRAHQLCVWGRPENVKQNRARFESAISGFAFPGNSLVESVNQLPMYQDDRAGFSVRVPGSGWTVNVNPVRELAPLGTFLQFQRGPQMVQVMGLGMLQPGQDLSWAVDTVTNLLVANYSNVISNKPTVEKESFAGIQWEIQTWRDRRTSIHMAVGARQRTLYAIIVLGQDGTGDVVMGQVTKQFRLLD